MNPFERIEEMRQILKTEVVSNNIQPTDTITQIEHYKRMMGMLDVLEAELKDAEYNYEIESVDYEVKTFDEMTVLQKELTEDVLIFQPIAIGEAELSAVDMHSLADVLTKMRDNGQIQANMLLLPPNINVFRAKLTLPNKDADDISSEE